MDNDKLVAVYLKMRAAKSELTKAYEKRKAEIEDNMKTVEGLLQGSLIRAKAKSMRTEAGTFYVERSIKPSCTDWAAYHEWMAETGNFEGVEKRVGRNFIVDFIKTHPKLPDGTQPLPPGITTYEEDVVRVRVGNDA